MNKRLTKKKKQELLLKILANKVSELDEDGGKYKARKLHKSFSELKTINRINPSPSRKEVNKWDWVPRQCDNPGLAGTMVKRA